MAMSCEWWCKFTCTSFFSSLFIVSRSLYSSWMVSFIVLISVSVLFCLYSTCVQHAGLSYNARVFVAHLHPVKCIGQLQPRLTAVQHSKHTQNGQYTLHGQQSSLTVRKHSSLFGGLGCHVRTVNGDIRGPVRPHRWWLRTPEFVTLWLLFTFTSCQSKVIWHLADIWRALNSTSANQITHNVTQCWIVHYCMLLQRQFQVFQFV